MNNKKIPNLDSELEIYHQDLEPETYFPASSISDHFPDNSVSEDQTLEFLAQEFPNREFSEHSDALDFLAKNLPTYKLFEVYEEACESMTPGVVFADYIAQIQANPSLFETSQGNREGHVELDFSRPSAALLYFDFDPDA